MELPFTEAEKRFVAAEVIKSSDVALQRLLELINTEDVKPAWPVMLLPGGRTVTDCVNAFEEMLESSFQAVHNKRKSAAQIEGQTTEPPRKRRQSATESSTPVRNIKPKPAATGSPAASPVAPITTPRKRGRPSKADLLARRAEGIARGERDPTGNPKPSAKATQITNGGIKTEEATLGDSDIDATDKQDTQTSSPKSKAEHESDSGVAENASKAVVEVLPKSETAADLPGESGGQEIVEESSAKDVSP
ncbi:hypothetical protein PVAG01_04034 [Phlyctema vagabunda]|uniref:Uncharacterized protein n=1 Tax=Phlyctema vagabunda TaxID=108571 RepID=A0ABR4PN49_9HELO